jgi:hypothetical protein
VAGWSWGGLRRCGNAGLVSGLGTLSRETKTRRALFSRRASRHQIWRWRWRWMSRCGLAAPRNTGVAWRFGIVQSGAVDSQSINQSGCGFKVFIVPQDQDESTGYNNIVGAMRITYRIGQNPAWHGLGLVRVSNAPCGEAPAEVAATTCAFTEPALFEHHPHSGFHSTLHRMRRSPLPSSKMEA